MCHQTDSSLVWVMVCCLFIAKPLHKPMPTKPCCQRDTWEQLLFIYNCEILIEIMKFSFENRYWRMMPAKVHHFIQTWMCWCKNYNCSICCFDINPLRAKFFKGNINIHLHFVSFLHIDMTQVLKILPQVKEGPTYCILSISWLLMSQRHKEPGHQQPWYWAS